MIEFEDAGFRFGRAPFLQDISLQISEGSFHIVIGGARAGKTTFLRLCHLELGLTSGKVRFFGKRISGRQRNAIADLRRRIGMMHQTSNFLNHMSILENIALPMRVAGKRHAERSEDLEALLEWVDLTDVVNAKPDDLSGTQRRQAELARAIALNPDVVLADAPGEGVAQGTVARLLTLFVELNRLGKTIVIAARHPEDLEALSGRVDDAVHWRLADGRLEPSEAWA